MRRRRPPRGVCDEDSCHANAPGRRRSRGRVGGRSSWWTRPQIRRGTDGPDPRASPACARPPLRASSVGPVPPALCPPCVLRRNGDRLAGFHAGLTDGPTILRRIDVLIFAAPLRSPELRHEIPAGIGDPFLYGEHDGRAFVVISTLDADNVHAARLDAELLAPEALGIDDLLAKGMHRDDAQREVVLRACRELGVQSAAVPPAFPLALADHLRAGGVELAPDRELFDGRRRAKTALELAGIRRAQLAAEAGMRVAAGMLAAAVPGPQGV